MCEQKIDRPPKSWYFNVMYMHTSINTTKSVLCDIHVQDISGKVAHCIPLG